MVILEKLTIIQYENERFDYMSLIAESINNLKKKRKRNCTENTIYPFCVASVYARTFSFVIRHKVSQC